MENHIFRFVFQAPNLFGTGMFLFQFGLDSANRLCQFIFIDRFGQLTLRTVAHGNLSIGKFRITA